MECIPFTISISAGGWCLSAWGWRNNASGCHKEQFWFCPDTKCTAPQIVMKELRQYAWNIDNACVAGSRVTVVGEMSDQTRITLSRTTGVVFAA